MSTELRQANRSIHGHRRWSVCARTTSPTWSLRQEAAQGGAADCSDEAHRSGWGNAVGGHDLVGGDVEQHDHADALCRQARLGGDHVARDGHQCLVDRQQCVDLLLDSGDRRERSTRPSRTVDFSEK
ncbi:hypothetical protein [Streptomyces sp. TE5632]